LFVLLIMDGFGELRAERAEPCFALADVAEERFDAGGVFVAFAFGQCPFGDFAYMVAPAFVCSFDHWTDAVFKVLVAPWAA